MIASCEDEDPAPWPAPNPPQSTPYFWLTPTPTPEGFFPTPVPTPTPLMRCDEHSAEATYLAALDEHQMTMYVNLDDVRFGFERDDIPIVLLNRLEAAEAAAHDLLELSAPASLRSIDEHHKNAAARVPAIVELYTLAIRNPDLHEILAGVRVLRNQMTELGNKAFSERVRICGLPPRPEATIQP